MDTQKFHQLVLLKNTIETQDSEIIAYPEPSDLKVRPIAGGNQCQTRKISNFIDTLLKHS